MNSKKFTLIGGSIGLLVISLLLFSNQHIDPAWSKWWQLKPLVIVPIVCALSGRIIYYLHPKRPIAIWKMIVFMIFALLCFFISLWLGIIVGLDGTLWN